MSENKSEYGLRSKVLSPIEVLAQSIANIAPTASPTVVIPLVFAIAGVGSWAAYAFATVAILLVAWSVNVFAKDSASPGSIYVYSSNALGPKIGAITGWLLIIAYLGTAAAVTGGFTNYLNVLLIYFGIHPISSAVLTIIPIVISFWVAYKDIKLSVRLILGLELASVSLILVLTVVTLIVHPHAINPSILTLKGVDFGHLQNGLVLAMFSFVGFESAASLGDEAKNPLHNIPKALVRSAVFVGIFFVFVAYTETLGDAFSNPNAPLNKLAVDAGIPFLIPLISFGAVISFFACTLASINAGARIIFHMARHGLFPSSVEKTSTRHETPSHAILLSSILTFLLSEPLVLTGASGFQIYGWVGAVATLGFITTYIIISVAAPVYLKQHGRLTVKGVVIPALAIVFLGIAFIGNFYPAPATFPENILPYIFIGYVFVGIVYFFVLKKAKSGISSNIRKDLKRIETEYSINTI